jgi:hypothetical protein
LRRATACGKTQKFWGKSANGGWEFQPQSGRLWWSEENFRLHELPPGRQPGEERIPRHGKPRTSDPAQRHPRLHPAAGGFGAVPGRPEMRAVHHHCGATAAGSVRSRSTCCATR